MAPKKPTKEPSKAEVSGAMNPTHEPDIDRPYWFTVKFGVDEQKIFNSWVYTATLRDHMKAECGYNDIPEEVDLLKEDGTTLVGLSKVEKRTYANELIASKGTYFLCKLSPPSDDGEAKDAVPTRLWEPAPVEEGAEAPAAEPLSPAKAKSKSKK